MSLDAKETKNILYDQEKQEKPHRETSLCEVYNILTKEFGRFSTEPHKGSVPL
jgi:hypothetical protein